MTRKADLPILGAEARLGAAETGCARLSRPGVALDRPTIHNLEILENFNGRKTWLISTGALPSSRVLRAA